MGGFWVLGGQNHFFRNFERARTLSEISVASESPKNTEFYEKRLILKPHSHFRCSSARGGSKKYFLVKLDWKTSEKKIYGQNPKTHRLTPFRSTQCVFFGFFSILAQIIAKIYFFDIFFLFFFQSFKIFDFFFNSQN